MPQYIYLFKAGPHYKIGCTVDVRRRAAGISTPFKLEVVHVVESDNMKNEEKAVFYRLRDYRLNREWFDLPGEEVEWFKAQVSFKELPGVPPKKTKPVREPLGLSIPIVADQMKVTEKTVHNWIASGKLTAREEYHGRQRRRYIAYSALEAFKATLPPQSTAPPQQ